MYLLHVFLMPIHSLGEFRSQDLESIQLSNSNAADTSHLDELDEQAKSNSSLSLILPTISEAADFQSAAIETSPVDKGVTMETANVTSTPVSSSCSELTNDSNINAIAGLGFSTISKNYLQCDRNDSRKTLLSMRKPNSTNCGYRKEYLSPNKVVTSHAQKVRLPGMECFIENTFKRDIVSRETDKENTSDFDFDHQYLTHTGWQMASDYSQYSLSVWRPWGK